jgi:hypothetical protein
MTLALTVNFFVIAMFPLLSPDSQTCLKPECGIAAPPLATKHGEKQQLVGCTGGSERPDQTCIPVSAARATPGCR